MVFLFILIGILVIYMIFIFSKLQFRIVNFQFSSLNLKRVNSGYEGEITWYIFGKIPILKTKLNEKAISKLGLKEKFTDINIWEERKRIDKGFFKDIKKLKFYIKKMDLKIDLGTENAALTSMIVPAISTVLALFLRDKIKSNKEQFFIIQPVFKNQNYLNIEFSGIFEVKMNHIINIIYLSRKKEKKGVKENERTSNRGSYDYGYE